MELRRIEFDPEIRGKVTLAVLHVEGVTAEGESPELERDLAALTERIGNSYKSPADAVDLFQTARSLYRTLRLDPTKNRPSSEALIRRVITGRGLYRINRVVDTCNLCSLDFALPIGLYDTQQVHWPVILRRGMEGEGYRGLGKDRVHVGGRYTMVDEEGPFGNPSSDSYRTRIRTGTRACTFVIFAPAAYDAGELDKHLDTSLKRFAEYCGGSLAGREIVA